MTRQRKGSIRIHRVISDYGIKDYYKAYRREHKGSLSDLDYSTYSDVLDDVLKGIANAMVEQMYDFKLPYSLGKLVTRKYKPMLVYDEDGNPELKRGIDWPSTRKLWVEYPELERKQFVYYINSHSGGYTFTIIYRKNGNVFRNKVYYAAQINRSIKRRMAKNIFEGKFDALETKNR